MDNQISLCLQTDAHAQLDPAGRPLTRCYSRWDAVIPCYPSNAAFIAAPQTEPLSPNPHSLRVSGRCSSFLPPPTRRLVSQLSSPGKTLHLLDIFNELHLTVFTCLILRFPWRRRPWVPRLRDPSLRWAPAQLPVPMPTRPHAERLRGPLCSRARPPQARMPSPGPRDAWTRQTVHRGGGHSRLQAGRLPRGDQAPHRALVFQLLACFSVLGVTVLFPLKPASSFKVPGGQVYSMGFNQRPPFLLLRLFSRSRLNFSIINRAR